MLGDDEIPRFSPKGIGSIDRGSAPMSMARHPRTYGGAPFGRSAAGYKDPLQLPLGGELHFPIPHCSLSHCSLFTIISRRDNTRVASHKAAGRNGWIGHPMRCLP